MELFKKIFAVRPHWVPGDFALLLARVAIGLAFMMHGWTKIQNPFGWMGPQGFAPGFFQALAAISEFGGGLAWIIGLLTPLASLGIACTMTVAVATMAIMMHAPFVSQTAAPAFELPAAYFCIAVILITLGPGRFSLDRLIFGKRPPSPPHN
jgi:putative oxidoreductase